MKQLVLTLITFFVLISCKEKKEKVQYKEPEQVKGGWVISTPDKEGVNKAMLEEAVADFSKGNSKLDGLLIARNGKLIVEEYFNGYTLEKLHKAFSITKAVTGTTLGIAIDKGYLSEKDSIYRHLGRYVIDSASVAREITIEHLITMTSGLEWAELGGRNSTGYRLPYSDNWVEFVLSQPKKHEPGKVYNYSTGNTVLLAPIIKNATGKQAREFANENLFMPLGIKNYEWYTQSEFWTKLEGGEMPNVQKPDAIEYDKDFAALTNTGSGLLLRPRDMCKIGQLYLNKGKWEGEQIVSENWITASTQPHFGNEEYGYHWRLTSFEGVPCYYASGFGVQRIFVFPTLNMVVVTTQQNFTSMPKGRKTTNVLIKSIIQTIRE